MAGDSDRQLTVRLWRALARLAAIFVLAVELASPAPAGTEAVQAPGESIAYTAGSQEEPDIYGLALACHMHFEHHQLIGCAIVPQLPSRAPLRARFVTRVNPLSSCALYPPRKPPRA